MSGPERFPRLPHTPWLAALVVGACAWGCRPATPPAPSPSAAPEVVLEPAPEATPLPAGLPPLLQPFTGDLDGMVERRVIRVLTAQNPILYFVDRGREVGITYETIEAFEKQLNDTLGHKDVTVHVIAIPVARDQLLARLLAGEGDIAAAALTVTPERQAQVDFSSPFAVGVREVLVTSAGGISADTLDDLSGQEIYVRPSSSYAEHLRALNREFRKTGEARMTLVAAPEVIEDGDILEMVSAGLVPATVVDDYMADLYLQVFPKLRKNAHITGPPEEIAWAFRKGSPKLATEVNTFVKNHRAGSVAGNALVRKYLKTTRWVRNARSDEDRRRYAAMAEIFKKYAAQYSFDHLLLAAQAYEESGLDQTKRGRAGAVGVMQVRPAMASEAGLGIPELDQLEANIHAGIKYDRWMVDNYFKDPAITPLNQQLLAFASYNAGPAEVASLRKDAAAVGLDPNAWFNNVELVAARKIGRETVTYVSNIYKYSLAYQLMTQATAAPQAP